MRTFNVIPEYVENTYVSSLVYDQAKDDMMVNVDYNFAENTITVFSEEDEHCIQKYAERLQGNEQFVSAARAAFLANLDTIFEAKKECRDLPELSFVA